MKIETLTGWEDLNSYAKHGWIFRGHRCATWDLRTSLERCCDRHKIAPKERCAFENRLIREFRRSYHLYAKHLPEGRAIMEWIALMQHHGAPTRLLDFTYSIHVAAYFATEEADEKSAIWAIDAPWVLAQSAERLRTARKDGADVDRILELFQEGDDEVVERLCFDQPYVCCSLPITPFQLNERLRIQQGTFLITGDIAKTFTDNLAALAGPGADDHMLKIVIPPDEGRRMPRRLFEMGVSRTTLFPGIDGYSQSLGVWTPAMDPIDWKRSVMQGRQ